GIDKDVDARSLSPDGADRARRRADRLGGGKVAGEDRLQILPTAVGLERRERGIEVIRGDLMAFRAAKSGAARHEHGRERPSLMAQVLERWDGSPQSHTAAHNV